MICALLGAAQGVSEWLPISSKTINLLLATHLLGLGLSEAYLVALGFEGGAVAAAAAYFRNVLMDRGVARFLIGSVIGTALTAAPIIAVIGDALEGVDAAAAMGAMGVALLIVSALPRRRRGEGRVGFYTGILAGAAQGLAALPGVSRSGVTIAALMALGFDVDRALALSYAMYVPAGAAAALYGLYTSGVEPSCVAAGYAAAAAVSLATISILMRLARAVGRALTAAMGLALLVASVAAVHGR